MPDPARHLRDRVGPPLADSRGAVARVAFWSAVALPLVHVPLLAVGGLDRTTAPVLAGLWALHALALVAGASYDPDRSKADRTTGDGPNADGDSTSSAPSADGPAPAGRAVVGPAPDRPANGD